MGNTIDLSRNIPRLGLNRMEVASSLGVSASTVDLMVEEGFLPRPRKWHTRKVWLVADLIAAIGSWPEDGNAKGEDADDASAWEMSA
ncbi:hypothetical protein [Rhizobium sp. Leaf384]|uniref:helix-turn-helix transcriptional regulator n=1 Tax=Rhizobium sp. Leaf384 TaxID=1736358 RepID=UPI0012E95BD0|nr:hypothetical protein [Rhizobium sp. Leaf384]